MKKIIAIAVASAFVAPSVLAEVVVYGVAAPSVEYSKISDTTSSDLTRVRLVDNLSRIGFKGTDKLDNGLKLLWQVENRVYIGTGDQSRGFNTRDTFVGVEGNFGRVVVGTAMFDLPFQARFDYLRGLINYNETINGVQGSINQSQARLSNLAQYTSPVFLGGAQVNALYDFGAKTTAGNYQGYQATATYKFSMLKVGATYKQNNDTNTVGQQTGALVNSTVTPTAEAFLKNYLVGATLTPVNGLDVSVMWDRKKTKASTAAAEIRQDAWAIGANYATGKHGFGVHYGKIGNQKNMSTGLTSDDTGAYLVAGQYKYALSKQTYMHASVGYTKNDINASYSMGTTYVTGGSVSPAAVPGMKVTTIAAGVTTSF
ncbi:Outer membrane protein (porin) [Formivibrio citricus]|uniref:Outer membrane protein (Porin) n=1 Tax=Formivibrio citricus TaxID=83765 RepID=A0A1I5AXT7_9NEIS|nr:porin [Formivibrio citricus]SFN67264.1 Outer membrane protein (porin) [Formivibrio citricus]